MDLRENSFPEDFRSQLDLLMRVRRDVRRFRSDPVDEAVLQRCLGAIQLAPSVGLSEPWRIIRIESEAARSAALANFETANAAALAGYSEEKAERYAKLKLSGMREAPCSWQSIATMRPARDIAWARAPCPKCAVIPL